MTKAGEGATNYPALSANFTTMYTVTEGMLRGFRAAGTAFDSWKNRGYYFTPRREPGV